MKQLLLLLCITHSLFAMSAKPKVYQDYHIVGLDTSKQKVSLSNITNALSKVGIEILDTTDMNAHFLSHNKKSDFKSYHVLSYIHKDISTQLIKNNPKAGLFYPAGMAVYQKKDDPYLWVVFLSSRTHSKILKLKKREMLLAKLDRTVLSALLPLSKRPRFLQVGSSLQRERKTLNHFKFEIKKSLSIEKILAKLSKGFHKLDYELSSPLNINKHLKVSGKKSDYDFYYSFYLSKPDLLYVTSKLHPEVGAFTPLTLIVYKKKADSDTHIIYPDIANAIDSSNIAETVNLRALSKTQGALDDFISNITKKQ